MSITHAVRRRALSVVAALALAVGAIAATAASAQAAPAAPVIELLTDAPQSGAPVELRLSAADAVAFHYGVNFSGPQHRVEAAGEAVVSFTAASGRTTVYAWAEDAAGELSPQGVFSFVAGRFIAPAPVGAWRLDGNGVDDANRAGALALPASASWEPTAAPAPFGRALKFDGSCAPSANGTALRTDAAFWVSAWVRLDAKDADQVLVAKAGLHRTGFSLGYDAETDRFTVRVADRDAATGHQEFTLSSATAPETGVWTQVSVTSNPDSQQLRLYRDGVLDAESGVAFRPGAFTGPVVFGCDAHSGGAGFTGALTHAAVWQGLPNQAYLDAAYRGDLVPGVAADWRLRGDGSDAAAPGRALDLPASVTWGADQYGRAASAAVLDGDSCATVDDRVLSSQGDLSVEAWVKLDSLAADQTVMSQSGGKRDAFSLGYDADAGAWRLALPSDNGRHPQWAEASGGAPAAGEWTHLAATVTTDRSGSNHLALYVNGALAASTAFDFAPLAGKDLVALGCSANTWGRTDRHLDGSLAGVRLWRGALGADAVTAAFAGNPKPTVRAGWSFSFGDIENWADRELTIVGAEGTDWNWEDVFEGNLWTALRLDGSGNGYGTSDPAVVTDESFSVITAINLADTATDQTFVAQAGADGPAFDLGYDAALDRIRFTMPSADGTTAEVLAPVAPATSQWIHVAAVYDLKTGTMRLYLDGLAVASADGPSSPWRADGPVTLGIAADTAGNHWNPLNGAISNTFLYESVATDREIKGHAGIF